MLELPSACTDSAGVSAKLRMSPARGCRSLRIMLPVLLLAVAACGGGKDAPTTDLPLEPIVLPPPPAKLPTLAISTTGGVAIASKTTYVPATMVLADSAGTTLMQGGLEIRGRGNTTWEMPKKPYRIRLTTSTSLLGMPANRNWVLLANFSDKTLIRNDLTFALSKSLGMAWTPRTQFVAVTVNGSYDGVYQLVEHVRVGPDRVNIPELRVADTSATNITGGYLLEVDERRGESFCFNSTMTPMVFCVANPDVLLEPAWNKQRSYIQNYIARTDSALFGTRFTDPDFGYAAFIDVESAINYYLIQEIVKNVDGNLRFSSYLHKQRNGKLFFGPVWDFDLAIGNANYNGADLTSGWYSRNARWYTRMFQDPAFAARVSARWQQLKSDGTIDAFQKLVYARSNYLNLAQVRNFERWPILGTYVWPNRVVTGSYDGEVISMYAWLDQRVKWMDGQLSR